MTLVDHYQNVRAWLREVRLDLHVIFTQCQRGGLTLLVAAMALAFWIGVVVG